MACSQAIVPLCCRDQVAAGAEDTRQKAKSSRQKAKGRRHEARRRRQDADCSGQKGGRRPEADGRKFSTTAGVCFFICSVAFLPPAFCSSPSSSKQSRKAQYR